MVSSVGCLDPIAALTHSAQLAPPRRAKVAHDERDDVLSVESVTVAGNTSDKDSSIASPPAEMILLLHRRHRITPTRL
jgi:hypothetical protein